MGKNSCRDCGSFKMLLIFVVYIVYPFYCTFATPLLFVIFWGFRWAFAARLLRTIRPRPRKKSKGVRMTGAAVSQCLTLAFPTNLAKIQSNILSKALSVPTNFAPQWHVATICNTYVIKNILILYNWYIILRYYIDILY